MKKEAKTGPEKKKVSPEEKKKIKEGIEYYTKNIAKNLSQKIKLDTKSGERLRMYAESLAVDARDFSLSFLPEKTQKHVVNMNKEALLVLQSLLERGVSILERPRKIR